MTDMHLLSQGYTQCNTSVLDNEHVVSRFQKRFDDNIGKKYFINVLKWSNEFIPMSHRSKNYEPSTYEYEVQVEMLEEGKPINFHFFSHWTIEEVEEFMEAFFKNMNPNYYEKWD